MATAGAAQETPHPLRSHGWICVCRQSCRSAIHQQLVKLIADGYSAGRAAEVMGRSRMSVIGRCFRKGVILGQKGGDNGYRFVGRRVKQEKAAEASLAALEADAVLDDQKYQKIEEGPLRWLGGDASLCKYPFGTPGQDDYKICANQHLPSKPYCKAHDARCHEKSRGPSVKVYTPAFIRHGQGQGRMKPVRSTG